MAARASAVQILFAVALFSACGSEAPPFKLTPTPPANLPPGVDAPSGANGQNKGLVAIGRFWLCSAAAIDVGGGPAAPAYLLTAGHCVGFDRWQANEIHVGESSASLGSFETNLFWDTRDSKWIDVLPAAIEYSTLHMRDVAVVRLDATMADLRALGVDPLPVASALPAPGDPIAVIGYPGTAPLLRSRCQEGETRRLVEDEYLFTAEADECAAIAPGSSGSPALDASGRVFGVVSTGTDDGYPCSLDHPCDLAEPPNANPKSTNYVASIAGLGACFPGGVFDLRAEGCGLARPPLPVAERGAARYTRSIVNGAPAQWNVAIRDEGLPFYRFKSGPAETTRCDVDEGYGGVAAVASAGTIADPIGTTEGRYVLCIHGGTAADVATAFTKLDSAFALVTEIDDTPPSAPPQVQIILQSDQLTIAFADFSPDHARYHYRIEAFGASACDVAPSDGMVDKASSVSFPRSTERRQFCVTAEDAAGNTGAPATLELNQ
jgi:hypothetical protein